MNVNCRSALNKTVDLEWLLHVHEPHIVALTDTWLSDPVLDDEIIPADYYIARRDRGSRGGGVALLIKRGIQFTPCTLSTRAEFLSCRVIINDCVYNFIIMYRPPDSSLSVLQELHDYLFQPFSACMKLIMLGEFNLPNIDWINLSCQGPSLIHCAEIIDIAYAFKLVQVVSSPTRGDSVLDLVFLSDDIARNGSLCEVVKGISDHDAVLVTLPIQCICKPPSFRRLLDFTNADDVSILDMLSFSFVEFECLSGNSSVETLWNFFKSLVLDLFQGLFPQSTKIQIIRIRGSRGKIYI